MTLASAIAIVEAHQLWRRGLPPYDEPGEPPSYTPAELTQALALVVDAAKQHHAARG